MVRVNLGLGLGTAVRQKLLAATTTATPWGWGWLLMEVLLGCATAFALVCWWRARRNRRRQLPGNLIPRGTFMVEDPVQEKQLLERRRDFLRIVAANRCLLARSPRTTPLLEPVTWASAAEVSEADEALEIVRHHMRAVHLLGTSESERPAPDAADGLEAVAQRVVSFISVTPGVDFLTHFGAFGRALQPCYLLMVSRRGQVRAAWYAFISDDRGGIAGPGASAAGLRSTPFLAKLVTEDLARPREPGCSWTVAHFSVKFTTETDINTIIVSHVELLHKCLEEDDWGDFLDV